MSYTANNWPAGRWPNFSFAEMACSETGECDMDKGDYGPAVTAAVPLRIPIDHHQRLPQPAP
jgi:hypothetical protein